MFLLILTHNFIHVILWWNMNDVYNLYQLISNLIVGRVSDSLDLEFHINLMHIFGYIISSNYDVVNMCCYVIISLIIIRFADPIFLSALDGVNPRSLRKSQKYFWNEFDAVFNSCKVGFSTINEPRIGPNPAPYQYQIFSAQGAVNN